VADQGTIYTVYGYYGPIVDITDSPSPANLYLYYQDPGAGVPELYQVPGPSTPAAADNLAWWWGFTFGNLTHVLKTMWTDAIPGIEAQIQGIASRIGYKVALHPTFPDSGRIRAFASPGTAGQILVIDYWVPGISYDVDVSDSVNPLVTVSFTVEIMIVIQVWAWPQLPVSVQATLHNVAVDIGAEGFAPLREFAIKHDSGDYPTIIENRINGATIPSPDISGLTSLLLTFGQDGISIGLSQFQAAVDPSLNVLNVTLKHPPSLAPYAYDPAHTMLGDDPRLGLTQYQAKPGAQVGVKGTNFPDSGAVTVAWQATTDNVESSYVTWGPGPDQNATVQGPVSEYTLFNPDQPVYTFQVRNFDGLQNTPLSNPVSIARIGEIDLVLAYSQPRPPHLGASSGAAAQPGAMYVTETLATIPASPGTFSESVTIPANALPGSATLMAQSAGQTLASVELAIVSDPRPTIYFYDWNNELILPPLINIGQTMSVHGDGFTPGINVRFYIDQMNFREWRQILAQVQNDGTFTVQVTWPSDGSAPPGNHTILAHQAGIPGTVPPLAIMAVTVLEPPIQIS
jgi:hypothetical protein